MEFYRLIQTQDLELRDLLLCYHESFPGPDRGLRAAGEQLTGWFQALLEGRWTKEELEQELTDFVARRTETLLERGALARIVLDQAAFQAELTRMALDKFVRTCRNHHASPSARRICGKTVTGLPAAIICTSAPYSTTSCWSEFRTPRGLPHSQFLFHPGILLRLHVPL